MSAGGLGHFVTRDVHAMASVRDLLRHVRGKLSHKGRAAKEWPNRKALYRLALEAHADNRRLYLDVVKGRV